FPVVVAHALKAQGYEVHCVGLRGHVDESLRQVCDSFVLSGVARIGAHIRYFHRRGVQQATLAGKIFKHKILLGRYGWLPLLPDLRTLRAFFPVFFLGKKDRKDDTLLNVVVKEFAKSGITMAPATNFAPELLDPAGTPTR